MREQPALKPAFWLISLPLFIALYRKTANGPQGEDKRDDCEGALDLEDKIGNLDDDVEDKKGDCEGDLGLEDKTGGFGDNLEDKRVDEEKRDDVEGQLFTTHNFFLVPRVSENCSKSKKSLLLKI